jgi:hypothetical protein
MKNVELRTVSDYNADPNVSENLKFRNRYLQYYKMGYVLIFPNGSAQLIRSNKSVADHALKHARINFEEGYHLGQGDAWASKDRDLSRFNYLIEKDRQRGQGYIAGYDAAMVEKSA